MSEILNKVAESGIVTIDLEQYFRGEEKVIIDLKPLLFQELILKEKEFRAYLKSHNWKLYSGKWVALCCSNDAVIPTWAYMLIALELQPYAKKVIAGDVQLLEILLMEEVLNGIDFSKYKNERVVIKGCSKMQVPMNAYVKIANALKPYAKSIMYGEPCSTVPLYKSKKINAESEGDNSD